MKHVHISVKFHAACKKHQILKDNVVCDMQLEWNIFPNSWDQVVIDKEMEKQEQPV